MATNAIHYVNANDDGRGGTRGGEAAVVSCAGEKAGPRAEARRRGEEGVGITPGPWEITECRDGFGCNGEPYITIDVCDGGPCEGSWQIAALNSGCEAAPTPDDLDEKCWAVTRANARAISAVPELIEYAKLEAEYSRTCDRRRTDWNATDIMAFVDKYQINGPIGEWLGQKRTAALTKAGVA